jgi:Ca-activated chloride channel family protein
MKRLVLGICAVGLAALLGVLSHAAAQPQQVQIQNADKVKPDAPKLGDPTPFTSKDGKIKGWKMVIPGGRALATPAVVDGKVFIGGGFGSHEFYAFDAATGKNVWVYRTADDGPTAAVVDDGHISFNTESCELEILTLDGKQKWKKWLGDPLMSMPAISAGKVYMAYPDSKGDKKHYVACFELKTGKEFWKHEIAGEIITAPVVADEKVYLATLEGTMYCFGQHDGELVWKEKKNATSSPAVGGGQCYFSRREAEQVKKDGKEVTKQTEVLVTRPVAPKGEVKDLPETKRDADDLDHKQRKVDSNQEKAQAKADLGVGFGANSKGDGKLMQAEGNLGRGNVSGVWSFQGSRPFLYDGRLYSAMADTVKCVDPKTDKVLWSKNLSEKDDKDARLDGLLTPPALVNGKIFMGTTKGDVVCLSAEKGELLWKTNVGEPILFQPAVVGGRVFVSTNTGSLFALETGDPKDDGWKMWGGSAAHNGPAK